MKYCERVLIEILKAAIHNKKYDEDKVDWQSLYDEVNAHQISPIIYHSLKKETLSSIDKDLLNKWKKEVFILNVVQKQHIKQIADIVNNLQKQGIEVLLLKGIVLRNLYPIPELRTMSDGDILIHKEDFQKVRNYLESIGYECGPDDNKIHRGFFAPNKLEIEVHWNIINEDYFNGYIRAFEDEVWKRKDSINFSGITSKTLCLNDLFLHLSFHMVVHAKYSGFGLRQLYDIALLIKNKYEDLDWKKIISYLKAYKVYKFMCGIMILINKIFDVRIPEEILCEHIDEEEINLLLENILMSGAHGKKEERKDFKILFDRDKCNLDKKIRLYKFIFPESKVLKNRYPILKEYYCLLPVYWIRYLIGIFRRNGFINTFRYIMKSMILLDRRNMLTKSYGL